MKTAILAVAICGGATVLYAVAGRSTPAAAPVQGGTPAAKTAVAGPAGPGEHVEVPPPPFSEGIFPCSECHNKDMPANRTRRVLSAHDDIVLKHDEQHRWCLDCHDAENRDVLHLASGDPLPFAESYQLCGQCHGEKYRDWRAGVHGRRVGQWNGTKRYLLCVHCHSPHQPRFKPIEPRPAPHPPTRPGR
jgi:hypothetical protein